uniref:Linker for activation of T cells family member 2 n=1 Tax=Myotis lucifugus TaxID=59463 RepID=G1Q064_MYOLU
MSAEAELLWPGVAFLLLLGAVASLCVRCSRSGSGAKRPEKIYEQRNLKRDQRGYSRGRENSVAADSRPGPSSDLAPTRKDKLLQFSPSLEDSASPRYLNFSKGSRHGSDASYMSPAPSPLSPLPSLLSPADDEDANSYENVLICKQKEPDSGAQEASLEGPWQLDGLRTSRGGFPFLPAGPLPGSLPAGDEDYQNSASIQKWRESRKVVGQVPREAPLSPAGIPDEDEDGEPDYVNEDVAATEA